MEWEYIFSYQCVVAFTTMIFCAGLMGDKNWFLVFLGLCFAFVGISILVSLFEITSGNGFTALGISAVVIIIIYKMCNARKDDTMGPLDDYHY